MSETEFKGECIRYAYLKYLREHTHRFTNAEAVEMLGVGDRIITYCVTKFAQEEQEKQE